MIVPGRVSWVRVRPCITMSTPPPPFFIMRCLRYMQGTRAGGRLDINARVRVLISEQYCLIYTTLKETEHSPGSRLRTRE